MISVNWRRRGHLLYLEYAAAEFNRSFHLYLPNLAKT